MMKMNGQEGKTHVFIMKMNGQNGWMNSRVDDENEWIEWKDELKS